MLKALLARLSRALKEDTIKSSFKSLIVTFKYIRPYRKRVLGFLSIKLAATLIGLYGSVAFKNTIDSVIGKDSGLLLTSAVMCISFSLFDLILSAVSSRMSVKTNLKISKDLLSVVFGEFLNTSWEDISEYKTGDLISRISNDAGSIAGSVTKLIYDSFSSTVTFVCTFALILYYDISFAIIAVIATFFNGAGLQFECKWLCC